MNHFKKKVIKLSRTNDQAMLMAENDGVKVGTHLWDENTKCTYRSMSAFYEHIGGYIWVDERSIGLANKKLVGYPTYIVNDIHGGPHLADTRKKIHRQICTRGKD